MIIVFPMLMDNTISSNIIPGICATLEKFVIIYKSDIIMKWGGLSPGSTLIGIGRDLGNVITSTAVIAGGAWVGQKYLPKILKKKELNEQIRLPRRTAPGPQNPGANDTRDWRDYNEYQKALSREAARRRMGGSYRGEEERAASGERRSDEKQRWERAEAKRRADEYKARTPREKERFEMEKKEAKYRGEEEKRRAAEFEERGDEKNRRFYLDTLKHRPDLEVKTGRLETNTTLSLEPTYITIGGRWGTEIIGIKVIPVPVDPEPFVKQLVLDQSGEETEGFIGPVQRKLTRMFTGFMHRYVGSDTNLKLNPFDDIIYASSKYGSNVFCLLNLASLTSDEMFKQAGGMERAFKMGWNSLVVADDISKRAYFCMKEFGGICSSVNYSFMMSSLHDKYEKSFEKLEDLKKSSSIYFSKQMKKPAQIIGESYANEFTDRFKGIGLPCVDGDCKED